MKKRLMHGFVQVYTGEGKGKTTAALGLGLRAVGNGLSVYMIQFMKGQVFYGELESAKQFRKKFVIKQFGRSEFVNPRKPEKIDIEMAEEALNYSSKIIKNGKYDIVILDEVNVAVKFGLIKVDDIVKLIKMKPGNVELVLTGRYAHPRIIKMADLVTEMKCVKHYYDRKIMARDGIER